MIQFPFSNVLYHSDCSHVIGVMRSLCKSKVFVTFSRLLQFPLETCKLSFNNVSELVYKLNYPISDLILLLSLLVEVIKSPLCVQQSVKKRTVLICRENMKCDKKTNVAEKITHGVLI